MNAKIQFTGTLKELIAFAERCGYVDSLIMCEFSVDTHDDDRRAELMRIAERERDIISAVKAVRAAVGYDPRGSLRMGLKEAIDFVKTNCSKEWLAQVRRQ